MMTEVKTKSHFTYIVQCADGSLYTGWTTDLESRMEAHNSGAGAKYTRGRGPVRLVYSEAFETKSEALKRECQIKKLERAKKLKLAGLGKEDNARKGRTRNGRKQNNDSNKDK